MWAAWPFRKAVGFCVKVAGIGPEGSFLGLLDDEIVLDDEELDRALSEIDRLSPLFSDCPVCLTNKQTNTLTIKQTNN